jgi:tyrosine decarboxylase / aspartate 1-decarboxylase
MTINRLSLMNASQEEVLHLVQTAALDETSWDSGLVFNTLSCQPHPLALASFVEFADRNLLKEQSVSGRRMEADVVREYSSWFGSPDTSGRNGYVCSGGTECNFVALWSAKARSPKRKNIVVSRYAHYSYDRFAFPLGLNIVSIPLKEDLEGDIEAFVRAIDEETLVAVITAGDPVLGRVDSAALILEAAGKFGCSVHVDAAYGGYILPFLPDYREIYGSLLAMDTVVSTLSLDPHKYGLCALGTGLLLFSDREDLDRISLSVPFPPIEARTFQGSRSAGPTASVWAMTRYLGKQGYEELAQEVVGKRLLIDEGINSIDDLEFVIPPRITAVGFRVRGDEKKTRDLYDALSQRGYRITPQVKPSFFIRVIAHHHTRTAHIERLCETIRILL